MRWRHQKKGLESSCASRNASTRVGAPDNLKLTRVLPQLADGRFMLDLSPGVVVDLPQGVRIQFVTVDAAPIGAAVYGMEPMRAERRVVKNLL